MALQATFALPEPGPTVFLFFERPMAKTASPRNTLVGHLVTILAGALSLAVFGLLDHPSILAEGVTLAHVGAGALSVALTGAVLLLLRSSFAPAYGRNDAHSELGLLQTPREMTMLIVGIVLVTVASWLINRAFGVPMPIWSAAKT